MESPAVLRLADDNTVEAGMCKNEGQRAV
jgi:hypothetical protein